MEDRRQKANNQKTIMQFEDLESWQHARQLTREIYILTPKDIIARDFGLCGQIQRAAVSVMSNLAEGFERSGSGEFYQFLSIAKSSCAEVRSQLYVALDVGYLDQAEFDRLFIQAEEVSRIIGGLRASIEKRRKPKT